MESFELKIRSSLGHSATNIQKKMLRNERDNARRISRANSNAVILSRLISFAAFSEPLASIWPRSRVAAAKAKNEEPYKNTEILI